MRGWQGFAVTLLGLTLLEVVVSNPGSSSKVGGLATGAGNLVRKILSPTVPVFAPSSSSVPLGSGQPGINVPNAQGQGPTVQTPTGPVTAGGGSPTGPIFSEPGVNTGPLGPFGNKPL